jgi:hypothetical protein
MNKKLAISLVGLMVVAAVAVYATDVNWASGTDTAKIVGSGTGNATLSVDAIAATVAIPSGALTDSDELATLVTPVVVANANGGTNVVTFTITDIAGAAVTYPVAFRFYITDAIDGAVAAVAGDVAISGGVELQQVVDKAHYLVTTTNGATSTVTATITDTPGGTNYIHAIAPCGRITRVVSAFDVP